MPQLDEEQQLRIFRQFTRWFAIAICVLVSLPTLYGLLIRPAHTTYFGLQYNLDDHMVYGAWMRQAIEGRLLFENRFATETQPGLTLHVYFLLLGWLAKGVGIPVAMFIGRVAFTFSSILLLGKLVEQVTPSVFSRKLALSMSVLGGGLGFIVWHSFGVAFTKPGPEFLQAQLLSRLPTDIWQPEGFFLPSALTNGLFMVSLTLILGVVLSVLQAKESKKAVIPGAICFGLLMNIHSYDVLLLALVFVGLIAVSIANKQLEKAWVGRVLLLSAGVIPFALWFVYVLKNDPVFQARAETLTFSPNYRQLLFGYILLVLGGIAALFSKEKRVMLGLALFAGLQLILWKTAESHLQDGFFMSLPVWGAVFAVMLVCVVLIKPEKPALALIVCWAMIGLIAPYFPALFQRKLTMMLSIPWGLLAGLGIARLIENRERGQRNLLATLVLLLGSATGLQWIMREISFAKRNVSNTTVHAVYQTPDLERFAEILRPLGGTAIVAALPGVPSPGTAEDGSRIPDSFDTPVLPDLNPIIVAMTGAKAYAGHWSETPNYEKKRSSLYGLFSGGNPKDLGITHLVLPKEGLPDGKTPSDFGEVLTEGTQFSLIRVP